MYLTQGYNTIVSTTQIMTRTWTQLAIDFCNMYIDKFICKSKISTSKLLPETILFKASQKVTFEITNKIK